MSDREPTWHQQARRELTRRELLGRVGAGAGSLALTTLLTRDGFATQQPALADAVSNPLTARRPHFTPRAKNVIFLHMIGAPSQLDLFEPKPALNRMHGKDCPAEIVEGARFAFIRGTPRLMGTPYRFKRHGESGMSFSELLPHMAQHADDWAIIRSLHTQQFNHAPAQLFLHTGIERFGRPSMGSWVSYGLGTENANLPAFVVLVTGVVGGGGNSLWGSGFLPTIHQGVEFRSEGDPVLFLSNPQGVGEADRRRMVDDIHRLNREQLIDTGDPEIATRIGQYEMAFRMQRSVPELMDLSDEPEHVHALYGTGRGGRAGQFAGNCLLARRLVERGVRFVQLFDQGWDHHNQIYSNSRLESKCQQVDQPIGALIGDLKQRGLLEDTLVVFAGEFGRTPLAETRHGQELSRAGRDHHKDAFCALVAGGGTPGGSIVGRTDDFGYFPVEDPHTLHDFQATLLHQLGFNHERLTYRHQGQELRLTDVHGHLIEKLIG